MSIHDQFELLLATLKEVHTVYRENVMGTLGLILIGVGWVITSKDARYFLSQHRLTRYARVLFFYWP